MKALIIGGTGFVGSRLVKTLIETGYKVVVMTRNKEEAEKTLGNEILFSEWDDSYIILPSEELEDIDVIINLAGESIGAGRWTDSRKERIIKSRVKTTKAIIEAIEYKVLNPKTIINASAIGYYGPSGNEEITEESTAGDDFLAKVSKDWELEANKGEIHGVRVVPIRIGMVLGDGGALEQMIFPFKIYLGGPLGSGEQWVSWVHIDDLIGIIRYIIENEQIRGPVNATAPYPVKMKHFSIALGNELGKPSWLKIPTPFLQFVLGEMADLLVNSQRVKPEKITKAGYSFKFPVVEKAFNDILKKS